jgi:hypothetical protein
MSNEPLPDVHQPDCPPLQLLLGKKAPVTDACPEIRFDSTTIFQK